MTSSNVVRSVIRFVGIIGVLALIGTIWLIAKVIAQGSGKGTVDPGSIAVIIPVSNLAAAALAGMTGMLVSTRSSEDPPQPVQVVDQPVDVVPVEDADG